MKSTLTENPEHTQQVSKAISMIPQLNPKELNEVINVMDKMMSEREQPVAACPYCKSAKIVRNGHKHGKQAYVCRTCGRSFVSTTGTVRYWSQQTAGTWKRVISDTIRCEAIKYTAEDLGVSRDVVFHMRHKILRALELDQQPVNPGTCEGPVEPSAVPESGENVPEPEQAAPAGVAPQESLEENTDNSGIEQAVSCSDEDPSDCDVEETEGGCIITLLQNDDGAEDKADNKVSGQDVTCRVKELDETFVLESYKGKKLPTAFWRKPRNHGGTAQKPGISEEYVCICASVERNGKAYATTVNRAKPSTEELKKALAEQLSSDTLVLCDGLQSYRSLCADAGCSMRDVNKVADDERALYNLNCVNNFHSMIKEAMRRYRGVATKYLNRYNALFSCIYKMTPEELGDLTVRLLTVSSKSHASTNAEVENAGLLPL